MLTSEEQQARREFYADVFGADQLALIEEQREHLWPVQYYQEKIEGLSDRGFANPVKMIASQPTILCYSFDNIDAKIDGLRERGFANPVKMITLLPTLLSLSFDNIDAKIDGLRERGFANPVKMITSLPAILNLSFDNINHKLRLARRLGVDAQVFITHSFVFISMSARHYVPLIRACRRVGKDPTPRNIMWAYKKKLYL